jgi:hypothetical protein
VKWLAHLEPTERASLDPDRETFALVGPNEGEIKSGERVTLSFTAKPFSATSVAGAVISTTLDLFVGSEHLEVPVRATAGGAALTVTPRLVDFGQIPLGAAALDIPVTLKNTGNQWINVGLSAPADGQFSLAWRGSPEPVDLGPGLAVEGLVARFRPAAAEAMKTESLITVKGVLCAGSATSIPLAGQGTKGVAGVQPGLLDYGQVACGATGAAQTITISNAGTAPFTFTPSMVGEPKAKFEMATPNGTTVAPGSNLTVVVTPLTIPTESSIRHCAFFSSATSSGTAWNRSATSP